MKVTEMIIQTDIFLLKFEQEIKEKVWRDISSQMFMLFDEEIYEKVKDKNTNEILEHLLLDAPLNFSDLEKKWIVKRYNDAFMAEFSQLPVNLVEKIEQTVLSYYKNDIKLTVIGSSIHFYVLSLNISKYISALINNRFEVMPLKK